MIFGRVTGQKPASAVLAMLLAVGCQSTMPPPEEARKAIDEALSAPAPIPPATPPAAVLAELLSPQGGAAAATQGLQQERRLDISADAVDAAVFFAGLAADSRYSLVVHPDVTGTLTLDLKGVTLTEVLNVVSDLYGYEIQRSGDIIRILPAAMQTATFPLNYLFLKRFGESRTAITSTRLTNSNDNNNNNGSGNNFRNNSNNNSNNSGSNSNNEDVGGTRIHTQSESDYWSELQTLLSSMIGAGEGRQVMVSPQSGLVTVRALPSELRQVRAYLNQAESHLQRQVLLEAKIIEVTLADGYQQGISWDAIGTGGRDMVRVNTSQGTFGDAITGVIGGITGAVVRTSNFDAVVTLLNTQGSTNVLSSPRITATNNQKAVIKVGNDEYFVTDFTTTTVTGTTTSSSPSVELTPFFSGIALDVMPQIDEAGNVLLHVHPSITDVKEQVKVITLSDSSIALPLARSDIRETDTIIRARSGDIVVIGGLMTTSTKQDESKVPILGDIPLVGELFKNRSNREAKTELVIMIKPTLVTNDLWEQQLQRSRAQLDEWFPPARQP